MADPFTQMYNALWEIALTHPDVSTYVRENNRIDHTNTVSVKSAVSTADFPELRLGMSSTQFNRNFDSGAVELKKVYAFTLTGNNERLDQKFCPLQWGLLSAFTKNEDILRALEWEGERFVKKVAYPLGSDVFGRFTQHTEMRGWLSVWQIEVWAYFTRSIINGTF